MNMLGKLNLIMNSFIFLTLVFTLASGETSLLLKKSQHSYYVDNYIITNLCWTHSYVIRSHGLICYSLEPIIPDRPNLYILKHRNVDTNIRASIQKHGDVWIGDNGILLKQNKDSYTYNDNLANLTRIGKDWHISSSPNLDIPVELFMLLLQQSDYPDLSCQYHPLLKWISILTIASLGFLLYYKITLRRF